MIRNTLFEHWILCGVQCKIKLNLLNICQEQDIFTFAAKKKRKARHRWDDSGFKTQSDSDENVIAVSVGGSGSSYLRQTCTRKIEINATSWENAVMLSVPGQDFLNQCVSGARKKYKQHVFRCFLSCLFRILSAPRTRNFKTSGTSFCLPVQSRSRGCGVRSGNGGGGQFLHKWLPLLEQQESEGGGSFPPCETTCAYERARKR